MLYIGTRGCTYPEWSVVFKNKNVVKTYFTYFNTVEIIVSKYVLFDKTVRSLLKQAPDGFKFSLFLYGRYINNNFKFDLSLIKLFESLKPFRDKISNIILDIPDGVDGFNVNRLNLFIKSLPSYYNYVVRNLNNKYLFQVSDSVMIYNEVKSLNDIVLINDESNYLVIDIDQLSEQDLGNLLPVLKEASHSVDHDLFVYFVSDSCKLENKSINFALKFRELLKVHKLLERFR